jgi:hypothetical protein
LNNIRQLNLPYQPRAVTISETLSTTALSLLRISDVTGSADFVMIQAEFELGQYIATTPIDFWFL